MYRAIAVLVLSCAGWLIAAPASAAPVPLSGHAAEALAEQPGPVAVTAAKRTRKTVKRTTRKCGWQCKSHWYAYQYRYWKFYAPSGGPLFSSRR